MSTVLLTLKTTHCHAVIYRVSQQSSSESRVLTKPGIQGRTETQKIKITTLWLTYIVLELEIISIHLKKLDNISAINRIQHHG